MNRWWLWCWLLLGLLHCSSAGDDQRAGTSGGSVATGGGAGSGAGAGGGLSGSGGDQSGTGGDQQGTGGATEGDASSGSGGTEPTLDGGTGGATGSPSRDWPQAAGPNGTWHVDVSDAPTRWSLALDQNVAWRVHLPNEGQGGIAIWGDRLFVETFEAGAAGTSATVLGHAVEKSTGKILWSVKLTGSRGGDIAYAFSDSTSWSPITDGTHVWFFNSSGEMGCWDFTGKEIWRRKFAPVPNAFPFNEQHEPILSNDVIISLEPGGTGGADWNYLRGIDKMTGMVKWTAEDPSTHYNTAVMGQMADGKRAVLHGRGGPHGVPETPVGLTMTSLEPGSEGKKLWRFDPEPLPGGPIDGQTFQALYNMTWDQKYAYWFRNAPEESHVVIDASTGKLVRMQSLIKGVDYRQWDNAKGQYVLHANVNIRDLPDPEYPLGGGVLHVWPQWFSNRVVAGYHYFLTTTNSTRAGHFPSGHSGPPHCIGRVNVETGKVEFLEVPVGVDRQPNMPEKLIYGQSLTTSTADWSGKDVAGNARSDTDGWEVAAFVPSPIALGNRVYLSTMLGITYVVDAAAAVLDEKALLGVNDLGPKGQAWSLATPSYSEGLLYHHSLKELVAIKPGP